MEWYVQLIFYFTGIFASFVALSFVEFEKFIKREKLHTSTIVYVVLSLAIGYGIGKLLISIGELFTQI